MSSMKTSTETTPGKAGRALIPKLATYLLEHHGRQWAKNGRGLLSFARLQRVGWVVVLRTPALGRQRLATAVVVDRSPRTQADWTVLEQKLNDPRVDALISAKHRYLLVERANTAGSKGDIRVITRAELFE